MKKIIYIIIFVILYFPLFSFATESWEFLPNIGTFDTVSTFNIIRSFAENERNVYFGNSLQKSGSYAGIDIYDKTTKSWSRFDSRNKKIPVEGVKLLSNKFEISDLIAKNNKIYVATGSGFLVITDKDTLVFDKRNSILPHSQITGIGLDSLGNVWMTNQISKDLIKFDGEKMYKTPLDATVPFNNYSKLICDKKNNIWYKGVTEIAKYNGEKFTVWNRQNSIIASNESISAIFYNTSEDKIYAFVVSAHEGKQFLFKSRLISIKDDKMQEEDLSKISNIKIPWDSIRIANVYVDRDENWYLSFSPPNADHYWTFQNFYFITPGKKAKLITIPFEKYYPDNNKEYIYRGIYRDMEDNIWVSTDNYGIFKGDYKK